jgi:hypothetical protein
VKQFNTADISQTCSYRRYLVHVDACSPHSLTYQLMYAHALPTANCPTRGPSVARGWNPSKFTCLRYSNSLTVGIMIVLRRAMPWGYTSHYRMHMGNKWETTAVEVDFLWKGDKAVHELTSRRMLLPGADRARVVPVNANSRLKWLPLSGLSSCVIPRRRQYAA